MFVEYDYQLAKAHTDVYCTVLPRHTSGLNNAVTPPQSVLSILSNAEECSECISLQVELILPERLDLCVIWVCS